MIGLRHYGSIDRLYLLHSADTSEFAFNSFAQNLGQQLREVGFEHVTLKEINPFDMQSVIDAILWIADRESPPFYINITGGTNLMAGAACSAAFFVGAQAYYVVGKAGSQQEDQRVLELPVPNIPYYRTLDKTQLLVLKEIRELGGEVENASLRYELGMSPQILSYHVKELTRKRLVCTERRSVVATKDVNQSKDHDRRKLQVKITSAGNLVLSWSGVVTEQSSKRR